MKKKREKAKKEKVFQLSKVYPTKAEAEKHARHFYEMGWSGTTRKTRGGWGVYYRLRPNLISQHSPRITPKMPRLK